MQSKFKPGDRVLVVKEVKIISAYPDRVIVDDVFENFVLPNELQPAPPFQRGDVVQNKRDPHAANMRTVLACFQDENGVFVFAAEGYGMLFECNRYEIFNQQNDVQ